MLWEKTSGAAALCSETYKLWLLAIYIYSQIQIAHARLFVFLWNEQEMPDCAL